uniref:Uncharacterized protein n=1 Tax=Salix viminalis TaxID=40686 RepID=A0A6N2MRU8_SALVM
MATERGSGAADFEDFFRVGFAFEERESGACFGFGGEWGGGEVDVVAEVGKLEAEAGEECHFDGEKGRGLKSGGD